MSETTNAKNKRRKRRKYSVERDLHLIELMVKHKSSSMSLEEYLSEAFTKVPKSYGASSVLSRSRTLVKKVKELTGEELSIPKKAKQKSPKELLEEAIKARFKN